MTTPLPRLHNCQPVPLAEVPYLLPEDFRAALLSEVRRGGRIVALFGQAEASGLRRWAVVAHRAEGRLAVLSGPLPDRYPALTPDCPQVHWFEREIAEQWGVRPEGHPWLKPIRFHAGYRAGHDA